MNATIGQAEVAVKMGGKSMTDNAAQGVATPAESVLTGAGIDRETVVALALKASETKRGGAVFKSAVLADKVRAQVRSRLGLDAKALVPVEVNKLIGEVCAVIATEFNAALAKRGFEQERASAVRNRIRGKAGEETLDQTVTVQHAKDYTWTEQICLAKGELDTVLDKLALWEQGMTPNRKPDTRLADVRERAREGFEARAAKLRAVIAHAEIELERIAGKARAEGLVK